MVVSLALNACPHSLATLDIHPSGICQPKVWVLGGLGFGGVTGRKVTTTQPCYAGLSSFWNWSTDGGQGVVCGIVFSCVTTHSGDARF